MSSPLEISPHSLEPATSIAEYSKTAAALAHLRARFGGMLFDVKSPKGLDLAREARAEVRGYRTDLEKRRQEIKAPVLDMARLIDAEAKRITAELAAIEDPIDEQIKAEERRREGERAARAEAEAQRIAGIRGRITALSRQPAEALGRDAAGVAAMLRELEASRADPAWPAAFDEFALEAIGARDAGLAFLSDLLGKKQAAEAEAARIAAEAAELAQRQAAAEAADALAREEIASRERAVREAERKQADERARLASEQARQEEEKAAQARQEAADRERQAAAERERQAAADRAAAHRRARLQTYADMRELYRDPAGALAEIAIEAINEALDNAGFRSRARLLAEAFVLRDEEGEA